MRRFLGCVNERCVRCARVHNVGVQTVQGVVKDVGDLVGVGPASPGCAGLH